MEAGGTGPPLFSFLWSFGQHPSQLTPWAQSQAQRPWVHLASCFYAPGLSLSTQWMFRLVSVPEVPLCSWVARMEEETMQASCRFWQPRAPGVTALGVLAEGFFAGERNTWVPFLEGLVARLCLQGQAPELMASVPAAFCCLWPLCPGLPDILEPWLH